MDLAALGPYAMTLSQIFSHPVLPLSHQVHRLIVAGSLVPGDVPVTVTTEAGQVLGMTCFKYVDDMLEMVKQLVQDPAKQSLWFVYWSQENGFSGSDSYFYVPQVFSPLNMPDQGMCCVLPTYQRFSPSGELSSTPN